MAVAMIVIGLVTAAPLRTAADLAKLQKVIKNISSSCPSLQTFQVFVGHLKIHVCDIQWAFCVTQVYNPLVHVAIGLFLMNFLYHRDH